jgi:hypothetical protein
MPVALSPLASWVTVPRPHKVLSTWERLGPVLMSTQPGVRRSVVPGNPSDLEVGSAMMNTQLEPDKEVSEAPYTGGGRDCAPAGPVAPAAAVAAAAGAATPAAVAAAAAAAVAAAAALRGSGGAKAGGDMSSTPDSSMFLAMGSTSGTMFSRIHNGSQLVTGVRVGGVTGADVSAGYGRGCRRRRGPVSACGCGARARRVSHRLGLRKTMVPHLMGS